MIAHCLAGTGFEPPPHVVEMRTQIRNFIDQHVLPAEPELEVRSATTLFFFPLLPHQLSQASTFWYGDRKEAS